MRGHDVAVYPPPVNRKMPKVCVEGHWTSVGRLRLWIACHKVLLGAELQSHLSLL